MILNLIWKYIGGWSNSSGIVISHKMNESEMEYRGSKSTTGIKNKLGTQPNMFVVVKEQRVDGSWFIKKIIAFLISLRCILVGLERDYQVKTRSNQINIKKQSRSFHTSRIVCNKDQSINFNPSFITGFTDAEGCFLIRIRKNNQWKTGWRVELSFEFRLHKKDKALLEQIKNYFGVGAVVFKGTSAIQFSVFSIKDMSVIINHFYIYSLITQKRADYEGGGGVLATQARPPFKQAFNIISNKEHLTKEGLEKIVALKFKQRFIRRVNNSFPLYYSNHKTVSCGSTNERS